MCLNSNILLVRRMAVVRTWVQVENTQRNYLCLCFIHGVIVHIILLCFTLVLSSLLQVASPCLRYLIALQSHLLQESMLHEPSEAERKASPGANEGDAGKNAYLDNLHSLLLSLAAKVFSGAYQVTTVL